MVASCYHRDTFLQAYGSNVMPVRDKTRWERTWSHLNMKKKGGQTTNKEQKEASN
jgi:hypothetical protein